MNKLPFIWIIPGKITNESEEGFLCSPVTVYEEGKEPENLSWKEFEDKCKPYNIRINMSYYFPVPIDINAKEIHINSIII